MLKVLGRYVHEQEFWYRPGNTIDLTVDVAGAPFPAVVLLPAWLEDDGFDPASVGATPLRFLWVVPITAGELQVKVDRGLEALVDLMDDRELSPVIDPGRACLVAGARS